MDFKEYVATAKKRLTIQGKYNHYLYFTKVMPGGYPCGYVMIMPNQRGYDYPCDYENSSIDCHGGITYDTFRNIPSSKGSVKIRVIGFDCAHFGDYNPINILTYEQMPPELAHSMMKDERKSHQWSAPELKHQCHLIINQLILDKVRNLI